MEEGQPGRLPHPAALSPRATRPRLREPVVPTGTLRVAQHVRTLYELPLRLGHEDSWTDTDGDRCTEHRRARRLGETGSTTPRRARLALYRTVVRHCRFHRLRPRTDAVVDVGVAAGVLADGAVRSRPAEPDV